MENVFKLTPCRPPEEPCDFECGSDDDITDKDLAVLLKEEAAKAETENKKEVDALKKKPLEIDALKKKSLDLEASKKKSLELDANKERKSECPKRKEQDDEEGEQRGKKRPCRKIIKNPFFTNRLKFSSDLPPRPPVPPPQFFPLADEDYKFDSKVCHKKKKCKNKRKGKTGGDNDDDDDDGGGGGGGGKEKGANEGADRCVPGEEEGEECKDEEEFTAECTCDEEPPRRRICKKTKEKKFQPPCRKKASDLSIPPQPRRIPAAMKDLPLTCPKDIPEVERQIMMSRDNDMQKSACKKKCKKKETVEQLLNQQ